MEARLTNKRQNKALHPTAYSFGFPLVPRSKPALPAAGELGRCVAAPAWMREAGSTLAADIWSLPAIFGGVGSFGGRGFSALVRRLGSAG